uniref:helix-turn-helix domain-containing protein n=1 Tax=Gemmiger formicilis TaxID=745368 RepID=UPI003FEE6A7A
MQRSVLHSKSFQRYFLTYAAIFAAMIFISILLLARTTNMERARAAEQQRSLQAEKISTQLDDMWKSAGSVGELLNNSSWVEKYKSDTDVFDADFDLVSRQEISQTLQNVCLSSTVVQDIGVIYPRKDTVITPQGWFDLQEYQTFLQRNHLVETEDFLDDVLGMTGGFSKLYAEDFAETTPDTLVYVSQLDILDSPRAIAVIYLDKSVIARQLQQISGAQVCAVRIANAAGDTRMQLTLAEPDPDDVVTMQLASRNMLLNYEISFENQRMPFMQGAGGYLLISGVAVLSMLLAYALAKMQYSPVNRLMRMLTAKTGVNSQSGDMDTIAFCIDNLFADNESLKKMVTSYQQTLNRQQVVQLLRGYFNEDVARLMQGSDNLFTENFVYAVLVLQRIKDNRESPDEQAQENARYIVILQHIVEKLCQEQNHCELVEQVDGNTAVIIEFPAMPDRDALMAIAETVHAALAEQDIESRAFVGRPCRGLAGISTSYQAAVETMQTDTGHHTVVYAQPQMEYYYPIEWESRLMTAVQDGNIIQVRSILHHLYEENRRLHLSAPLVSRISLLLTEDLHRTAVSMDLAPELLAEFREPHPAQRLETVFATAEKTAEIICAEAARRKESAADNVSRSLVEYVNTHIFDPELSLKQLGDEFSVSTASVSRIFKKSAGENFYHYITQKRIARAKELLLIQGYCPAQIAEAVGYDSEYSFKRAFVRTVGMAPRDYCAQNGGDPAAT